MTDRGRTNTIETMLVTILLILFAVAIFLLVASGGDAYNNILTNRESLSRARVASSYINVKIRQNDTMGGVFVSEEVISDKTTIVIIHKKELLGYITYIFYNDGVLYEAFLHEDIKPGMDNAMLICKVDELDISFLEKENKIFVSSGYTFDDQRRSIDSQIVLRTGDWSGENDDG